MNKPSWAELRLRPRLIMTRGGTTIGQREGTRISDEPINKSQQRGLGSECPGRRSQSQQFTIHIFLKLD